MIKIVVIAIVAVGVLALLILRDLKKQRSASGKSVGKRKVTPSLQEFLPLNEFHESGAMVVSGKYRRLVRVGDMNLYSMSMEEIQTVRDRFQDTLKHLDQPFQISVQARRANYKDYVKYSESVVEAAMKAYDNPTFGEYGRNLIDYLRDEAQKPRTDRENIIVLGVLPKVGGESIENQLERLNRELGYVESGLSGMGIPYSVLQPIEGIEAIQNFWNRERAVSQRYRDAFARHTHAPTVSGSDVEVTDIVQEKTSS